MRINGLQPSPTHQEVFKQSKVQHKRLKIRLFYRCSKFVNTSPGGSPTSLVSLESSIGSHFGDDPMTEIQTSPELKEQVESIKEIRIPTTIGTCSKENSKAINARSNSPVHRIELHSTNDRRSPRNVIRNLSLHLSLESMQRRLQLPHDSTKYSSSCQTSTSTTIPPQPYLPIQIRSPRS